MSLSAADVQRIAKLAHLQLDTDEALSTLQQLNQVFELIEALKAVDTEGVVPMTHATDLVLRLRDDVVSEPDRREDYQAIAPLVERGLYLVPKVIE